jgi:dsDNA-specific endonuclease/ATPase MutS2
MDGVPMITIIHGHGMGKIKDMVLDVFKKTNIAKNVKPSEDGRASIVAYL